MGSFTIISRQQQQSEQYAAKREHRLAESDSITADWRAEASIGEISDEDRGKLKAWLAYNKAVKATAVGEEWPEKPEA